MNAVRKPAAYDNETEMSAFPGYFGYVSEIYRQILEMYWKYIGNVLEIYWKCIGNILDNFGTSFQNILKIYTWKYAQIVVPENILES